MQKEEILIGWSCKDVTPRGRKVSLRGQFHVRLTEEVADPLTTTVLALESAATTEQALIVSLDAVGVSDYVTDGCRRRLAAAIAGFAPDKFFISCTHTHTAPEQPGTILSVSPPLGDGVMTGQEYGDLLIEKICAAAVEAWQSRKPGAVSWGRGHACVGYNRRMSYLDGSSAMYGATDKPEFSHIEGADCDDVDLLFTYDRSHELTGMIVNVPCPSQCSENGYFISADFWHETKEQLRAAHGQHLFVLAHCGAAGDQSPRHMIKREAEMRMLALKGYGSDYNQARRRDIADRIAAAVAEVLPLAGKDIRDKIEFCHKTDRINLTRRQATAADLNHAEAEVADWKEKLAAAEKDGLTSQAYSSAFRRVGFNQRVIDLYNAQQQGRDLTMPVELHILRIGDTGMCTNRFEFFLDFGLRIKARSRALQTFVVQLAGEGTYLPTERAMAGGSYGAYIASTPVGPQGGQEIVETQVENLSRMF